MHKRNGMPGGTVLACFSPPIMIATCIIELALAGYTVWRYKLDAISKLTVATLLFLATFQLAEYFVCGGAGLSATIWSRIGYAAITMLPPLGLHMAHVLAGKRTGALVWAGYATGLTCIAYFLLYPQAFTGSECTGNYVIFQIGQSVTVAYSLYYYGWLATVLGLAYRWSRGLVGRQRQALLGLSAGYLVFLVPTAITNSLNPATLAGIPSIMCGFAVLFAVILVAYILPRAGQRS